MDPHTPYQVPVVPGLPTPTPPTPAAPIVRKKIHQLSVVFVVAAAVLFVVSLVVFGSAKSAAPQVVISPSPVIVPSIVIEKPAVVVTTPPPPAAPPPPANPTVADGTWTVGPDIPAGKYRAVAAVDSSCYWGIYKTGSNGEDIISNGIPGGGRPQVTLKVGQDFTSQRCGTWEKIG